MEEGEEDAILLNSLGVTSANPEDIERHILDKARENVESSLQGERRVTEEVCNDSAENQPSSSGQVELLQKLRALDVEIDAVASAVEQAKSVRSNDELDSESGDGEKDDLEETTGSNKAIPKDNTLQHALAADRLRSLKKTRAELRKELSSACKDSKSGGVEDKILRYLVREESKLKSKPKDEKGKGKESKRQKKTVSYKEDDEFDAVLNAASGGFVETERDELVRKGLLTPFHKLKGFERSIQQPGTPGIQENLNATNDFASESVARVARSLAEAAQARPTTKLLGPTDLPNLDAPTHSFNRLKRPFKLSSTKEFDGEKSNDSERKRRPLAGKKWRKRIAKEDTLGVEPENIADELRSETQDVMDEDGSEPASVTLEGGLNIPETMFNNLFDYQKVGVQWLWELHCQRAGGIIGDEMGLGKTIQVLSFLGSLHFSNMYTPSIVVCPVTLLRQWKREAQKWYPRFHVEILHVSAVDGTRKKKQSESDESDFESDELSDGDNERGITSKSTKWDALINKVLKSDSGLLITTYEQLRILGEKLLDIEWGYAVLDEGHRIRNPNAEVTIVCKQLQTVHRIIMTGAPIQNKLSELWSLFDFVFPGKLGVLPVFEAEFAVPIQVGGYANASPLQVSTAYRCAVVLRDLIMPYLLRRMKADVNAQLPKKTEHVLFCSLTPEQRSTYRAFLASSEVEQIFDGSRNSLYGIDVMRKICNHPDLLEREHSSSNPDYGNPERSGKMKVVSQVLKTWKEQGHRVLLFAQTQQMLDILESFLIANEYSYRRMDGHTAVKHRMALIDEFNNSDDVFIFILTTKVGGLGTNLTGANRVIIFDPDWNPSTDMQARERAWRIGQKRDVTVYRLITRGTIEEKVYHRQIYKHFLTNKILKNPQQRRFFKARDLKDLFILTDEEHAGSTETSNIFGQLSEQVNVVGTEKDDQQNQNCSTSSVPLANGTIRDENNGLLQGSDDEERGNDETGKEKDDETNFLKNLFDAQGIHSAVNHDAIMDAHDEDKIRLDEQASQVAQRAAEALRQSRMLRSKESISIPTWTGKSGAAGAPSSVRQKFGSTVNSQLVNKSRLEPDTRKHGSHSLAAGAASGKALSSADLLARIRGNQATAVGDGLEHQFVLSSGPNNTARPNGSIPGTSRASQNLGGVQPEVLVRQICTFIQQRGGNTSSATIVEHFKNRIPSNDLPLFKSLLKEIALLEKRPHGSFWVLKPEYQ